MTKTSLDTTPKSPSPFQDKFCNSPFEYCYIEQNGDVFVCCPSAVPMVIGNLLDSDWAEIWNSPTAQEIRRYILDGSFFFCSTEHCPYLVAEGRLYDRNDIPQAHYRQVVAEQRLTVDQPPHEVNIAYDATCNLSCPYCRNEIFGAKGKDLERAQILHDKIWSQVLPGVQVLTMAGNGDAFASKLYREALANFDPQRYKGMKIQIVTNGLLLTPKAWEAAAPAHGAIHWINVSINAAGPETFAINQRGGKFETLLQNLAFIKTIRQSRQIDWLTFSFIVQSNNFHEMPAFVELARKYGADRANFTHLQPGPFSADEYRHLAIHRPEHPRHGELLAVLEDPLLRDPCVFAANLTDLIPGKDEGACHNRCATDITPYSQENAEIPFDEFADAIDLREDEQRDAVRAALNRGKEGFRELFSVRPRPDALSPLEKLAHALRDGQGDAAAFSVFQGYAAREKHPEHNAPYIVAVFRVEMSCQRAVAALLDPAQRIKLKNLHLDSMLKIVTDYDPIREGVWAILSPASAQNGGKVEKQMARSIEEVVQLLGLDSRQEQELRHSIRQLKDSHAAILKQKPRQGGQSPAAFLAQRLSAQEQGWEATFRDYLATQELQPGLSFLQSMGQQEFAVRQQLVAGLRSDQLPRFESVEIDSLSDLDKEYDPVGQAIQEEAAHMGAA